MAITTQEIVYQEQWPRQFMVMRLQEVVTGDTLDLSGQFSKIIGAAFISMMGGQIFSGATVSGTTVTINNTGVNDGSGFLIAVGARPS
jgi:hypothetical protein